MNHDAPAQRQSDGKWLYVRNGSYAIGYCSPHEICPDCKDYLPMSAEQKACKTCGGRGLVDKADPCPGHDTSEEACAHYKEYLLDTQVRYKDDDAEPHQLLRCQVDGCGAMTSGYAQVGPTQLITLCADHRNRETLEQMVEVGESWHS